MQRLLHLLTGSGRNRQIYVPLWALLIIFSLSFLYLIINFDNSLSAVTMTQAPYEAGEVIIFDASEATTSEIVRSGYTVIEVMDLKGLNVRVHLLKIPHGMSVPEALSDLQTRYPGLEINANDQVITSDPS